MDEILRRQARTGEKRSSIRYVYDKISVHVCGLASLGVSSEQYGSLLIPIIMSKLPSDIRLLIARKATKEAWTIDDLLTTIKLEIEAREISESTKSSGNNQQGNNTKNNNTSTAATLVANNGKLPDNSKIQCIHCSGHHYLASCEKIVLLRLERKFSVNLVGVSVVYGKVTVLRTALTRESVAIVRACKHHQSICPRNQKVEDPKTTEQPKDEERTTTATRICKGFTSNRESKSNERCEINFSTCAI